MTIEDITDPESITAAIKTMEADMKAMQKALASFKKNKALIKKVAAAQHDGRIDTTKATSYYNQIREDIRGDLIVIQDRGLALGQGDIGSDHNEVASIFSFRCIATR
jgi:predicted phosphoribosyltransferase